MEQSRQLVSLNNQLIRSIQLAQEMLNSYLLSPRKRWVQEGDSITLEIEQQIKDVKKLTSDTESELLLEDVDTLLQEKQLIGERLIQLIRSQNPITTIDNKIETFDEMVRDTIVVTTSQDTVRTLESSKRNFWGRLKTF